MTSLLFVDDEANVLSGLRRMLRGERKQWDMQFAGGGQEALDQMADRRFDVVISDMRMPGIDGAALLSEVQQRWPATARVVLSGQSEQERILRAIGPAHQYLSKPCDAERLRATVSRACSLRDRLQNDSLKEMVSAVDTVPSRPLALRRLTKALDLPDVTVERVGQIIASDVGMTCKVLQLVSSSFFGQPQRVTSAEQATALLGLDLLRELVLSMGIFSGFDVDAFERFSLDELTEHSEDVAQSARRIAALETDDQQVQGDAYLAGMLHDVGKIVLASCSPEDYRWAVKLAQDKQITLWQAEMEVFGASHAEVGSYLLGLWGLPEPVVEAVCFYRMPNECRNDNFCPLTTVHVANILCRKQFSAQILEETLLHASEYLKDSSFSSRVCRWRETVLPVAGATQ